MKRGTFFAVLAIFFYAAQNVTLERKLVGEETVNRLPLATMLLLSPGGLLLLTLPFFVVMMMRGHAVSLPQGTQWGWVLAASAALFLADVCYFTAYANNISVTAITTTAVLLPVFASVMNVMTGGKAPTWHECAAIPFACIAVYLVSRSN